MILSAKIQVVVVGTLPMRKLQKDRGIKAELRKGRTIIGPELYD